MKHLLFALVICLSILGCKRSKKTFTIEDLGKSYEADQKWMAGLFHHIKNNEDVIGGNTSIRNVDRDHLEWKGNPGGNGFGYYQRNRDLGQVFNVPDHTTVTIDALVLRTSRGNNAIMKGAPGSSLQIAFYEVVMRSDSSLKINENGTTKGDSATHGFDHQFNRADDYVEGVVYLYLDSFTGGKFPYIKPTDQYTYDRGREESFGEQDGHLRYFRCDFSTHDEITLEGGKRYAFIIGFEQPGSSRGLALAINSEVHTKEDGRFVKDQNGKIIWGIRREGNGTLPPTMIEKPNPPDDQKVLKQLQNESTFQPNHFNTMKPTSNGFPDVDTYRTLQYYLEIKMNQEL
ncbi:hypothetical protein [Portibacter marinus]|uniref:hypothetical protein n=1 Tax=Portibacter marinus TaxID=2898660 RepID=UPI001F1AE527|nr:hypothetical protein [Portibacter marinus]